MSDLLLAVVTVGLSSPGQFTNNSTAEADSAYRAGLDERGDLAKARPHFLRAAAAYEQIWRTGRQTPAVARNWAQCYLLAGDLGPCVATFRRALASFPHDRDLRLGLSHARGRVEYPLTGDLADATRPRDPPSLLERLRVPFLGVAVLTLAAWAIGWILLARAWMTVRGGMALTGGVVILFALLMGAWIIWEDHRLRKRWSEPTAVVATSADLRTGNSDEYPRRLDGRIPVGVELKVLGRRGGWLHVELADGTAGWVPAARTAVFE